MVDVGRKWRRTYEYRGPRMRMGGRWLDEDRSHSRFVEMVVEATATAGAHKGRD